MKSINFEGKKPNWSSKGNCACRNLVKAKCKMAMPKPMRMGKKAQAGFIGLIVGLLMGFMVVTILVTLIPGFVQMIDMAQGSDSLNCVGYIDTTYGIHNYSAAIGTKSTIGCLAIKLFIPYIVLAVLIGLVVKILYDRSGQQMSPYG